jgi:autotransporter-associated beta strand protein
MFRTMKPSRGRKAKVRKHSHTLSVERLEERMLLAVRVWDGGAADNLWSSPANWAGDLAPQGDDNLVFPAGVGDSDLVTQNDFTNTRFRTITISGGGYELQGNSVTLLEGVLSNNAFDSANPTKNVNTIQFDITIGASQSFVSATANTTLVLNGVIYTGDVEGANLTAVFDGQGTIQVNNKITGEGSITKNSDGTLILAGANDFDGMASLYGGVTVARTSSAFGTLSGFTRVETGAQLAIDGNGLDFTEVLRLTGYGNTVGAGSQTPGADLFEQGGGALRNLSGTNTWSGTIMLNPPTETWSGTPMTTIGVDAGSTLKVNGAILGPAQGQFSGLYKIGNGTLELGGSTANQIMGDVNVLSGTLRLAKTADVLAFNGNIVVGASVGGNDSAILEVATNQQQMPVAVYTGYTLAGVNVYHSGKIVLDQDVVQKIGYLNLYYGATGSADVYLDTGSTLVLGGNITSAIYTQQSSSGLSPAATISGSGVLNLGTLFNGSGTGQSASQRYFNVGETYLQGTAVDLDISVKISNAAPYGDPTLGLWKGGAGGLRLSADNDYTGGTLLAGGIVELASDLALSTGDLDIRDTYIRSTDDARTLANRIYLVSTMFIIGNKDLTFNGEVTLAGNYGSVSRTIVVSDQATTLTINSRVSDDFQPMSSIRSDQWYATELTKAGRGELVFTNEVSINNSIRVDYDGGTVRLKDDGRILDSRYIYIWQGGQLILDNTGDASVYETNRINDLADVSARGGNLVFKGRDNTDSSEVFGSYEAYAYFNSWIESAIGTNGTSKLTFGTIRRGDGASMRFIGTGAELTADGANQVVVRNPLGAPTAGWATGTLINGILPYTRIEGPTSYDEATVVSVPEGFAVVPFTRYVTIDASMEGKDITALVDSTSNVSITTPGTYYIGSVFINSLSMGEGVILRGTSTTTNLTIQGGNVRLGDGAELAVPFVYLGNPNPPANIPGNLQTIIAVRQGRTATISGVIAGSASLMKTGLGHLVLSGNNEFSGTFFIQEGIVTAQTSTAFGATTGGVRVMPGAELRLDGSAGNLNVSPETLMLCGQGFNDYDGVVDPGEDLGSLRSLAGNNTWAGMIYQNWPYDTIATLYYDGYGYFNSNNVILGNGTFYSVEAGSSLALTGQIVGDAEMIKLGPGKLELGGSQQNTPNAAIRVKEGELLLNKAAGVGTYRGTPIYIGDDDASTAPAVLRLGADEQIYDLAAVRVMSDGLFDLDGHLETLPNVELVSSPIGAGAINIGDGGDLVFQSGANNFIVLLGLGLTGTATAKIEGGTISMNYPIQGTITRSIVVNDTAAETDLTITSRIDDNTGIGVTNLYKYGYGTLELGGTEANTYSGLTRVYEGTLVLNKAVGVQAMGGPLTVGDDSYLGGGQYTDRVVLKNSEQLPDYYALVYVYGTGVLDLAGHNETLGMAPFQTGLTVVCGGVLDTGGGRLTVNGNITGGPGAFTAPAYILGGELHLGSGLGAVAHYVDIGNANGTPYELVISSNITGEASAHLFRQGDGGLLLSGNNTYAGDTFLMAATYTTVGIATESPFGTGVVSLGQCNVVAEGLNPLSGAAWKVPNRISLDGTTYFGGNGASRTDGLQPWGSGWYDLEIAGDLTLTGGRTLTVGFPINVTFSGDIGEVYGQQALYKAGPGFMTFTGTDWQSGPLVVNTGGGSLILADSAHVENASMINVYDGASLILDDTGIQSTDRIDDRIPLNLYGGTLQFGNSRTAPTSETLGIVTIGGGISPATIRSAAGVNSHARITIEKIVPAATYSYMEFSGGGMPLGSEQNQIRVLGNNKPTLVGSAGKQILGWGFISSPDGGTDFVTYDDNVGFKAQTNYVTSLAAAQPDDNVMLAPGTETISDHKTVNALMIEGAGSTISESGGNWTLTITSGALFTGTGPTAASATHSINVANLNLQGDANILTRKGTTTYFNTSIIGNSIAFAGKGHSILAGNNQQLGMTLITEGVVTAAHPNAFGTTAGATYVYLGAVLELDNVAIGNEALNMYSPGYGNGAFDNRGGIRAINGASSWGTGATAIRFVVSGASGYGLNAMFGAEAGSTLDFNGTINNTSTPMTKVDQGTVIFSGTASNAGDQPLYVNSGTLVLNKTAGMNAHGNHYYIGDDIGGDDADKLVWAKSNQMVNTSIVNLYSTALVDLNGQNEEWFPTAAGVINDYLRLYIGPTSAGDIDLGGGTLTLTNGNNVGADITVAQRYGGGPVGAKIYDSNGTGSLKLNKNGTPTTLVGTRFYVEDTPAVDDLTVSAVIADGAGAGSQITKEWTSPGATRTYTNQYSRLLFSGTNTFTGAVTINAGELAISNGSALGNATTGTQVTAGAALLLSGGVTVNGEPLTIYGSGLASNETGALRSIGGNNAYNGPVTLGVTTNVSCRVGVDADTLVLGGILGGTGGMVKNLPGTLELAGSASNTTIGNFFVWNGSLVLNKSGSATALGTGANIVYVGNHYGGAGSAVLQLATTAGTNQLPDGTRMELQAGGKFDLNGKTEQITTTSSWVLRGYFSYSTSAQVTGGTIGTGTAVQTIRVDAVGNYSPWSPGFVIGSNISMGAASGLTMDVPDGYNRYDLLITGNITGTGTTNMLKTDNGAIYLSGTNSYTGSITINSGTIVVSNPSQLGAASNTLVFNNSNNDRAVASIRAEGGPVTIPNPITLQGASGGYYAGILGREDITFSGNVNVNAAASNTFQLRVSNYGLTKFTGNVSYTATNQIFMVNTMFRSTVEISGTIGDGGLGGVYGHVQKEGFGTLILSGTNTYEGTTTINGGVLRITNPAALGQTVTPWSYTYVSASGVLELYGNDWTIDENFRAYGIGFGNVLETGTIRMLDFRPGVNDVVTLTGNINMAAGPGLFVGVDAAEDYLRMGGDGVISSSELQLLNVTATTGTYSLTFTQGATYTTTPLSYSATAAEIETALEALVSVGGIGGTVDVVKDPNRSVFMIYFRGNLDNINAAAMVVAPTAAATITEINNGGTFGLYKVGQGMLRLTGNGSNTYGGGTYINEGTLRLNMTEGASAAYATGKGNITIGDEGGGDNADRLLIAEGSNHDQVPDYATVIVAGSGVLDMATEPHDMQVGSLILTHSVGQSGDVVTGTSTLKLAGGTAYAPLGLFPSYPTLGVVNFGATNSSDPAPTVDGHLYFATAAPVITINDTLFPSAEDDLVVTAELTSVQAAYDAASGTYYMPGLREGRLSSLTNSPGRMMEETNLNPGSWITSSPRMGETQSPGLLPSYNPNTPAWYTNETYVYSGKFYDADGKFTFAESTDDQMVIILDGKRILRNASAAQITTSGTTYFRWGTNFTANGNYYGTTTNFGMGANNDGWHDIEIRIYNGDGGAGSAVDGVNSWANLANKLYTYGIRYNPNELQTITFNTTSVTGGTFTLNFNGQTTTAITYNNDPNAMLTAVKNALQALDTVDTVNVYAGQGVGATNPPALIVEFTGAEKATNVLLTGSNYVAGATFIVQETAWDGDAYRQILDAGDGSLLRTTAEATFNGKGTLSLQGTNNLSLPVNVTDGKLRIGTGGSVVGTPSLTVKTGATLEVAADAAPMSETQTLQFQSTPASGGYTLTFTDPLGRTDTTALIAWDATAAQVEQALIDMTQGYVTAGDITVSGSYTAGFTFQFGTNYAATGMPMLQADTSALNGTGMSNTFTEITPSLNLAGGTALFSGGAGGVSHYINQLAVKGNTASVLEIASTGHQTSLTAANLVREAGGTVAFKGTGSDLGDGTTALTFLATDSSAALVGEVSPFAVVKGPAGIDLATDLDMEPGWQVGRMPAAWYDTDINMAGANLKLNGTTATLTGANTINALLLTGGATVDVATYTLGIDSGMIVNAGGANVVQGTGAVAVSTDSVWWVDGTSLEFDAPISGSSSLRKLGTGRLVLDADNSNFAGALTVDQGVLRVSNNDALGAVTAGTTVSLGATLEFDAEAGTLQTPTVNETQRIDFKTNEIQKIKFIVSTGATAPTGGSFSVTYDPDGAGSATAQTTVSMPYNVSSAVLQNELQALPGIGAGNVIVSGNFYNGFQVVFIGTLAGLDVPELTVDVTALTPTSSLDSPVELIKGGLVHSPANEVKTLTFNPTSPTGGTYTLSFDPDGAGVLPALTAGAIAWNATAATVQTALQGIATIGAGNVVVSGAYNNGGFAIQFTGVLANTNIADDALSLTNLALTPAGITGEVATATQGGAAKFNETQAVYFNAPATTGTYSLTFNNATTSSLSYSATAAEVRGALELLGTVGAGNVQVSGNQNAGFLVTWIGALGGADQTNAGQTIPVYGMTPGLVLNVGTTGRTATYGLYREGGENLGGTITVNVRGSTTGALPWNASAQQMRNALETLQTIGSQVDERQQVTFSTPATGGTYTIAFRGATTAALDYSADAATVQAALEGLSSIGPGNIIVSGAYNRGGFFFAWKNEVSAVGITDTDVVVDIRALTPVPSVTVGTATTGGYGSYCETQMISVTGAVGGTWSITFDGNTTSSLAWNASVASIDSALEALPNVGNSNISVVGDYRTGYQVTFLAQYALANPVHGRNLPEMTLNTAALTGTPANAVETFQDGTAPEANFTVTGDYLTGFEITFQGELGGVDLPPTIVNNSLLPNTPTANVFPTVTETTKGAAEKITISGSGVDGQGALKALNGTVVLNNSIELKAVPPAAVPWDYMLPNVPRTATTTMLNVQSIAVDSGSTLVLNGRITQTLNQASLAKNGEGTLEMAGVTMNNGYDAFLNDTGYEGFTFLNAGTNKMNKLIANGAFGGNQLFVGDNEGGREVDQLVYPDGAQANQFGSNIWVWRSGVLDSNGRGDDVGDVRIIDSKWFGGRSVGTTIYSWGAIYMTGGLIDFESTAATLTGVTYYIGPQATINASGTGWLTLTNGARTFNISEGPAMYDLVINAPITGTAGSQLYKQGAGALLLNGDNSFTGTNEFHTVLIPGSVNSFLVTYNGQTSPVTATANLTTSGLARALESLTSIPQGSVRVTGGSNEVQALRFSTTPTGGTYRLSFRGYSTVAIPFSATSATVQTELSKLPSITTTANITVGGAYNGGGFTFTFPGAFGTTDVDTIVADLSTLTGVGAVTGDVYEAVKGGMLMPTFEVQQLTFDGTFPTTGNYTLTFGGATTAAIAFSDTAATVQTRLQNLSTIGTGNIAVAGAYNQGGFAITLQGVFGGLNMADDALTFNAGNTGVTATIAPATNGGDYGFNETQEIYFSAATGGTFGLTFNGQTTSITYSATAAEVQSKLEALSTIGAGNVAVVGDYDAGYQVTFINRMRGMNQNAMTIAAGSLLPAGRTGGVTTLREGSTAPIAGILFVNGLAGADVSQEVYTIISGAGTINTGTPTAGVWGAQINAGTLAMGHDNALGVGGLYVNNATGGVNTLWAAGGERSFGGLVSLANNFFAMGGRREWGGTYDLSISNVQLYNNFTAGTNFNGTGTTISVDDAAVDAKIGFINEVQQITVPTSTSSGTWTISFNGETSGFLPWNATPLQVQQTLNQMSSIRDFGGVDDGGSVSVMGFASSTGYIYYVTFHGTLGAQDLELMLDPKPTVSTAQDPFVSEATKGRAIGGSIAELSGIYGGRTLTKLGAGRLTLGTQSSYTGSTYVGTSYANTLGGRLRLQNVNALGVGVGNVVDVQGNAALEIDGTYTDVIISNKTLVLRVSTDHGLATGFMNDATGALRNIAGNNTWAGEVDLRNYETNDRWVFIGSDAGNLTISGEITGSDATPNYRAGMALAKVGAGKLTYRGWGANTLTGNVLLADGTLSLIAGSVALNGAGTSNMIYVGDHTTGSGRDVLELGAIEQVHDNLNLQVGPTGKIVTLPEMNTQVSREVQKIAFTGTPTGGTFCLTFDLDGSGSSPTEVTRALNWNATSAEVESALNTLPSVANSGAYVKVLAVDVLGASFDSYLVAYRGTLGGIDISDSTIGFRSFLLGTTPGMAVSTVTQGGVNETVANSEVQLWTASATTGTLSFRGYTTPALSNTAQPAVIEAALNALPSIASNGGYVRVTGAPGATNAATAGAYWITFLGSLSGEPMPNLVASAGTITEVSRGGMGAVETLNSGGIVGTFLYQGDTSSADIELAAGTSIALGSNPYYRVYPGITTGVSSHISGEGSLSLLSALQTVAGTRVITVDDGPANEDLIITATLTEGPAGIQANLQKDGAGPSRMVLDPISDSNTYTGITTINSGFLTIRSDNALGSNKTNEVQRLTLNSTPTAGNWTITVDGETTAALPFDAAPGEVADAINALSTVAGRGGYVRITNYSASRDFVITFLGGMAGTNWSDTLITVSTAGLTPAGITTSVVNQIQGGTRLATVINGGYTLELDGGVTVTDEPLSINGVGRPIGGLTYYAQTIIGTGALRAVSGVNTWQSTATANLISPAGSSAYVAEAGAKLVVAASINAGTSNLYKSGAGEVEITNPTGLNMTYTGTGATFVNEGVLVLNKQVVRTNEVQTLGQLGLNDEQQRLQFSATPTAGSWSLSFLGQTTALMAYNASATNVRDALAALSTVGGTSNVDVQGSVAGSFVVTFINGKGNTDYANMTVVNSTLNNGATVTVSEIVAGGTVANGTYTLNFNGQTTWPLQWNATPAQVQTALQALATVGAGNILVSGTAGGDMSFTFQNFLGEADLGIVISAQVYQTPSTLSWFNATEAVKGVGDEIQTVAYTTGPTGGYYCLTYNGAISAPIPFDADPAAVQAALEGIATLGAGNVRVMGGPGTPISPFTVRFVGSLAQTDVATLGGASMLIPTSIISVGETAKGGFTTLGQTVPSGTLYVGDGIRNTGTLRLGPNSSGNAIPDTTTVSVLPDGVFDLATNSGWERINALYLGVGGTTSAHVLTGTGTLALNPIGDTNGFYTLTFVDGGTNWDPAVISGTVDLASPQMPRTRRWFKVMDSPAEAELAVMAALIGPGGVEKSGQGVMILGGNSTYTGETIVNEGTLIVASGSALGAATDGTVVEWGASLGFADGVNYTGAESLVLASAGATSFVGGVEVPTPVLFNYSGNNSFAGPITVNYPSTFTSMTAGDTLTLAGNIVLNAPLTVDGVGNVALNGAISSGSDEWQAGLLEGRFAASTSGTTGLMDETFANTGTGGVKRTPAAGEIASTPPWSDYIGYVYTGQFYDEDGVFSFAENIDDIAEVKIDGITRLRNAASGTPSTTGYAGLNSDNPFAAVNTAVNYGMGANGDGWHDIEIRFYNGVGGAGAQGNNLWSSMKGFGLDPYTINTSIMGNAYVIPTDPGDMSLFRTKISSGNSLTKIGTGTLSLGGQNTYTGLTTVRQGKLLVHGSTGTGAVNVESGATIGGAGGVVKGQLSIASGASLAPGDVTGQLTVNAETTLATGSTFAVDLNGTTAGSLYDQVVQAGLIHLNGANLAITVGYTPEPSDRYVLIDNEGSEPIDGTFNGLVNHSIVNVGSEEFRIFYDGGDGNDVVLVRAATLAVSTVRYDAGDVDLGNGTQRSTITRIVVTFNGLVDDMDATGAFSVDRMVSLAEAHPLNVAYSSELVGENTVVTLEFTGGDAYATTYERPAASGEYALNDGNYRLTVDSDGFQSLAGNMADDYVQDFFRWFGDSDGDRDTDGADMFNIRRVLAGDPAYNKYKAGFDYDGDGDVDNVDYNSYFRPHYGRRLLPPT